MYLSDIKNMATQIHDETLTKYTAGCQLQEEAKIEYRTERREVPVHILRGDHSS
jgi:hypothetical protein